MASYRVVQPLLTYWTLALNNGQSVMVAYVDYAKAFDVVCHNKLTSKLSAYGIAGDLIEWIRNF